MLAGVLQPSIQLQLVSKISFNSLLCSTKHFFGLMINSRGHRSQIIRKFVSHNKKSEQVTCNINNLLVCLKIDARKSKSLLERST